MKKVLILAVAALVLKTPVVLAKGSLDCRLKFNLSSWSVFYKSGKGTGTITCDNGEAAGVK
ncbi:MAG: hypothetical protein HYU99_11560, partial [Deltaproteobacteria bacterium]|nr:hypothetical protein [Deltaproteobacteria bacterium]